MAASSSGRLVIIIAPALKKDLRRALIAGEITLKDWFIQNARRYIHEMHQPTLFQTQRQQRQSQQST
jgi:hypothetical protein